MWKVINLGKGGEITTMIMKFFKTRNDALEYIEKNNLRLLSEENDTIFVEPKGGKKK